MSVAADSLAPITAPLDPAIAPLVLAMRAVGLLTISSCEGHFRPDAFRHVRPNVVFFAPDRRLLHSWVRELSRIVPLDALPVGITMSPVWNDELDLVHEDAWGVHMDASWCVSDEDARRKRDGTVAFLVKALQRARVNRPKAVDADGRSIWRLQNAS